jgi:Protein of unknown function (DUF3179)
VLRPTRAALVAAIALLPVTLLLLGADAPVDAPKEGAASADPKAPVVGGFTLTKLLLPASDIISGGPKKDAIHSVDAPEFASVEDATWVGPQTEVLGLALGGEAHAYPLRMMEYHQIVNDVLAGVPVAATYDPLAGTPIGYRRTVGGRELHFGVSGLLYNDNFLLFDRETNSLWSQFLGEAIAGPLSGTKLDRLRMRQETGATWISRHPATLVLRHPDPQRVEYLWSPFQSYWVEDKILFPVKAQDRRYHAKELVLGVVADGKARAYLGSIATKEGGSIEDQFQGRKIQFLYDTDTGTFNWDIPDDVQVTEAYWLAWKAFHPDTEIWHDEPKKG